MTSYNEDAAFRAQQEVSGGGVERRVKVPKHMRLPKMEDWQFFDAVRLQVGGWWMACYHTKSLSLTREPCAAACDGRRRRRRRLLLLLLLLLLRLQELFSLEEAIYFERKAAKDLPATNLAKLVVLSDEDQVGRSPHLRNKPGKKRLASMLLQIN